MEQHKKNMKKIGILLSLLLLVVIDLYSRPIKTSELVGEWELSDIQLKDIEVNPKEMKTIILQYLDQSTINNLGNKAFENIAPISFKSNGYCTFHKNGETLKKKYTLNGDTLTIEGIVPHKIDIKDNKLIVFVNLNKSMIKEVGLSEELLSIIDIKRVSLEVNCIKK